MAVAIPSGNRCGETVTKKDLRKFLTRFKNGESKGSIERSLGIVNHKGKWITRAWTQQINVDTRHGELVTV